MHRVKNVIAESLEKKSEGAEILIPRYEVHATTYDHSQDKHKFGCKRAFATEQDAREYVAVHPYGEVKIIKVENTLIFHRPSNVEEGNDVPF